VIAKMHGCKTQ